MLTAAGCKSRRERLWASVPETVEWILVTNPRHVNYLCGFSVNPLSFSAGERAMLLLERDDSATLFADNFARRSAACEPFVTNEVIAAWYDHKTSVSNRSRAVISALGSHVDKLKSRVGLLESDWFPAEALALIDFKMLHSAYSDEQTMDVSNAIRALRRFKEADELELLMTCMAAGDAGHASARKTITPGVSELDVYRAVQDAAVTKAGRAVAVYGDFRATNAETFKAGGLPTDYVLKDGDLMIVDYSVVINGYRSDFTNTYAVGTPTADQQRMADACIAAVDAAQSVLRADLPAKNVYFAASQVLEEADFGKLRHHAGHGLGLEHPEAPILVPESTDTLINGDVVTIEPGAYVEGIGGMRFEHNYFITKGGCERLSNHELGL